MSQRDSPSSSRSQSRTHGAETPAVTPHTYTATLHGPLFFSSEEGTVIRTDPTVAATALLHAIGYTEYDLPKQYVRVGDETVTPDYDPLTDLPVFASEMVPTTSITADERTFRTVSYGTERTVVSSDTQVGEFLTGSKNPVPRYIEGSNAGWHKMREYIGVPPHSEDHPAQYTFTLWAEPGHTPPETLGFRLGIKRTGEVRARRTDATAATVSLNQYLLESVYEVDDDDITALMRRADEYDRGTDIRTCRFHGVDRDWVDTDLMPTVLAQ